MTPAPEQVFDVAGKKIWVAGHRGMVGGAVVRRLAQEDCTVLTVGRDRLDLRRQAEVESWLAEVKPDAVVLAAAKVGGILANSTYPAEFIYENLAIESNIIHGAHLAGVQRLLFLGSSCIYPRMAKQPITEEELLTGPLEPTNEWYAIAKIAGVKLCQAYRKQYGCDFVSAMPTNLYGPGDNFDLKGSHVLPALMVKIHRAKQEGADSVEIWGSGTPRREFLHVDDLADACLHLLRFHNDDVAINVGVGEDVTIRELAETIAEAVGYEGGFFFDAGKPDGTPRKLLDVSRLERLGWKARYALKDGVAHAYRWFLDNQGALRA
jgi:GDP-L-fucose synthase